MPSRADLDRRPTYPPGINPLDEYEALVIPALYQPAGIQVEFRPTPIRHRHDRGRYEDGCRLGSSGIYAPLTVVHDRQKRFLPKLSEPYT